MSRTRARYTEAGWEKVKERSRDYAAQHREHYRQLNRARYRRVVAGGRRKPEPAPAGPVSVRYECPTCGGPHPRAACEVRG